VLPVITSVSEPSAVVEAECWRERPSVKETPCLRVEAMRVTRARSGALEKVSRV